MHCGAEVTESSTNKQHHLPFYHYPQSRDITCLLDMKHSFFGLTQLKFATFRLALFTTFFTAQMGRGKIQWGAFTRIF
jgi:hypothetical protein